ncbi:protein phosphatase 2C domain-containing protein [Actinokineospora inagensis]|uniref:protein phosphatase 2C domain-containing protein n=1 Tax=Actinokineospora inagensis TaxID=103730 RepID=UPI000410828A|nr:protein phosphatase 2C domain-containing protein [Actinokineospora inagensis]
MIGTPVAVFEPRPPHRTGYRPDTAVDGWSSAELTVRGASVRGYQHRHDGSPRQDDFAVSWHAASGAVVAAVADGVSSVELAHLGATLACRSATDQLLRRLDEGAEPDWPELMRCASWALVEFARAQPGDDEPAARAGRLLSTTVVVTLVRPRPDGSAVASVCRVGDSTAWVLAGDRWAPVFQATETDTAEVATVALPHVPHELRAEVVELPVGSVLLLGTDGVGTALGDGSGSVGDAFAATLATAPPPLEFTRLLDFSRETFDDDRTLLAVWPRGGR